MNSAEPTSIDAVPGDHGGDAPAVARALGIDVHDLVDLSASLNPFAPDVALLASRHLDALRRYPDCRPATIAVGEMLGVDPDRLVLTNGGAEAIALVAGELPVGSIVEPEFSLYRRHLARVDEHGLRWRSNPGNPLGLLAGVDARADVWDEAFYPLATGSWTRGDEDSYRLGSLTKVWACPGLRLGYVIAPTASAANSVRSRQPQWSVGGLALALIDELIAASAPTSWAQKIRSLRMRLSGDLRALGFSVIDSDCNWVLLDDAAGLRRRLLDHRVLVRDCTSFSMPDRVRVALPSAANYDRVVSALSMCKPG